jgi:hypothetical protein
MATYTIHRTSVSNNDIFEQISVTHFMISIEIIVNCKILLIAIKLRLNRSDQLSGFENEQVSLQRKRRTEQMQNLK